MGLTASSSCKSYHNWPRCRLVLHFVFREFDFSECLISLLSLNVFWLSRKYKIKFLSYFTYMSADESLRKINFTFKWSLEDLLTRSFGIIN